MNAERDLDGTESSRLLQQEIHGSGVDTGR
jgi:hypothetical protein